jgi:hypothetical protein
LGARYRGRWRLARIRGAIEGHALVGSPRASFALTYAGGSLEIIGARGPRDGVARVTLDGRSRTVHLHSAHPRAGAVVYRARVSTGRHRLTVRVLSGKLPLEGLAIAERQK